MRVVISACIHRVEEQLVVIRLQSLLLPGHYSLSIQFASMLRKDLMGCYISYAKDTSGNEHAYVFSQFESNYARTCLPTFDEPRVKMPFSVRVTAPAKDRVLFNTEAVSIIHVGHAKKESFLVTLVGDDGHFCSFLASLSRHRRVQANAL